MRVYQFKEENTEYYMPHEGVPCTVKDIETIGIEYKHFEVHDDITNEMIITHMDTYPAHDVVEITAKTPMDKLNMFYEEHLHEDPEVRFIIDGSGYFDVRSNDDMWFRILVEKGDFIKIPAGLYHRFTIDEHKYIKALRLFTLNPKWVAITRTVSTENLVIRQDYLKSNKL